MNRISLQRFQSWLWFLPVLFAISFNLNVLQNGLGWDDEDIIPNLSPPERWLTLFLPDPTAVSSPKEAASYFRPLVTLFYLLDHRIWGDNPFGFHLSVFAAHLLNTALVFFLARRLMDIHRRGPIRASASAPNAQRLTDPLLPLLAASLFAVYPAHAEAIAWIAGRSDVFCTTFLMVSLLLYVRFKRTGHWVVFGLSMLTFALALLTKETAVGFFIMFPLYDYIEGFKKTDRLPTQYRPNVLIPWGWRIAVRWIIPLIILGLYFFLRRAAISRPYGGTSVSAVLLSSSVSEALGAFGLYLKLMVFPYPHNPFIATLPNSFPILILSGLVGGGLLAGLIFVLIRRQVVFAMGLAWIIATILPAVSASVLHVAATAAAERYLYGPSVGFLIVIAGLILNGLDRFPSTAVVSQRRIGIAAGLFILSIILAWGWTSWHRNAVWRNPMTFWQTALAASPEAGFPHRRLGLLHTQLKKYPEAEADYQRAIAIYKQSSRPPLLPIGNTLNDLAGLYFTQGRYAEAEPLYLQSLAIREKSRGPEHLDVAISLHNLALLYYAQGRYAEAEPLYLQSLAIREKALGPDHPDVANSLHSLAKLYYARGKYAESETDYRQAIAIYEKSSRPDMISIGNVLNDLAVLYHTQERYAEAEPLYQRSLAIREKTLGPEHPDIAASLENYAALLRKTNRETEAAQLDARDKAIRGKHAQ